MGSLGRLRAGSYLVGLVVEEFSFVLNYYFFCLGVILI